MALLLSPYYTSLQVVNSSIPKLLRNRLPNLVLLKTCVMFSLEDRVE